MCEKIINQHVSIKQKTVQKLVSYNVRKQQTIWKFHN